MRAQTTIRSIAFPLLLAMVFLFGTETIFAQTPYWVGGNGTLWSTAVNWSNNQVPTTSARIDGNFTVTFNGNASITSLTITGSVTFISDYILTIGTLKVGDAGGSTNPLVSPAAGTLSLNYVSARDVNLLVVNTLLDLNSAGSQVLHARINGNSNFDVRILLNGAIKMANVTDCWIGNSTQGLSIVSVLNNGNPFDQTIPNANVRFEGDVRLDKRVALGHCDVWLGEFSDIQIFSKNETFVFIGSDLELYTSFPYAPGPGHIGRLIKSWLYWYDGNAWKDASNQNPDLYFIFEVGEDAANGNMPLAVKLNSVVTEDPYPGPFRGVSVRYVNLRHPANQADSSGGNKTVRRYWVVQPVGFKQYDASNNICYGASFNPSDVKTPANAYAAIYSDNWEQNQSYTFWYNYGSMPFGYGYNIKGRTFCSMCPTYYFGDITIGESTNPVPVELTSFSARYIRDNVELSWQTATELNNYGFAIERSRDGEIWEEIDFVNGAGNSYSPKSYTYTDLLDPAAKRAPKLAYRLRQIDRDGTTEYSNIVFVTLAALPAGVELYEAYPNPFNPSTTISFSLGAAAPVKINVFDIYGREVATILDNAALEAGVHTAAFRASALPSGSYIVVLNAAGVTRYQRVVLNK
jgi:hypothetical protein